MKTDPLSATARKDASRGATKDAIGRELMLVSVLSRIWAGSHRCKPLKPQLGLPHLVCLHSPAGVMLWRYSDEESPLFRHLPEGDNHATDYKARDKEALLLMMATEE